MHAEIQKPHKGVWDFKLTKMPLEGRRNVGGLHVRFGEKKITLSPSILVKTVQRQKMNMPISQR